MKSSADAERVLYAFSIEPSHDRATLERYLSKYPELIEELLELSFELRLADAQAEVKGAAPSSTSAENAWQQFVGATSENVVSEPAALMSKFKGAAFVDLAQRLGFPRSILVAFRDRQVEPTTVPEPILSRFAAATESTVQTVLAFLSCEPRMVHAVQFKSAEKPSPQGRVDFWILVKTTPMTDDERRRLLEGCSDGLDRG